MIYIKLFRDMRKNIPPDSGGILRLGNHTFLPGPGNQIPCAGKQIKTVMEEEKGQAKIIPT
jgi:hypothetical protein